MSWTQIEKFDTSRSMFDRVDLWVSVSPSPMSMGMGDNWRVVDAYHRDGEWWHNVNGVPQQLRSEIITHFMERPTGPNGETGY